MESIAAKDQALVLAGYLLAHMAYLVAIEKVELLTPFSIGLAEDGTLSTQFHTGASQAEAVQRAKEELAKNVEGHYSWAFGREGEIEGEGGRVITISACCQGMDDTVDVIQQFAREPSFRLIDDPMIVIEHEVVPDAEAVPLLERLLSGVSRHTDAGPLWSDWKRDES